jgi:hypothetical protein
MNPLIKIIKGYNQDCRFTDSVNESNYIEQVNQIVDNLNKSHTNLKKSYTNFIFCILDNYDIILSNTPDNEKYHILNQKVINILSEIENDTFHNQFNYNEKVMKRRLVQNGLQLSLKRSNMISSIYYLNDLYKTHFVLVDANKKEYYETTPKNYPKVYLTMNNKKYSLSDTCNTDFFVSSALNSLTLFTIDVKPTIYKTYLESISKYKVGELKDIATNLEINLINQGKTKTKQVLYDEINLYNLNLI